MKILRSTASAAGVKFENPLSVCFNPRDTCGETSLDVKIAKTATLVAETKNINYSLSLKLNSISTLRTEANESQTKLECSFDSHTRWNDIVDLFIY